MSVALDHLWKWVDKGAVPPRADRILVDRDATNDGSLMALDESGNARGGIRNPYVDVPARKYGVRNEGASPPIPNAHPFVAVRDEAGRNQLCGLAGYEIALPAEQLRRLHRTSKEYQAKVAQRLDELTRQGLVVACLQRRDSRRRRCGRVLKLPALGRRGRSSDRPAGWQSHHEATKNNEEVHVTTSVIL